MHSGCRLRLRCCFPGPLCGLPDASFLVAGLTSGYISMATVSMATVCSTARSSVVRCSAQIEEYLEKYIAALTKLYEDNADKCVNFRKPSVSLLANR